MPKRLTPELLANIRNRSAQNRADCDPFMHCDTVDGLLNHAAAIEAELGETREGLRTLLTVYLGLIDSDYSNGSLRRHRLSEPVQTARRLLGLPPFTGDEP